MLLPLLFAAYHKMVQVKSGFKIQGNQDKNFEFHILEDYMQIVHTKKIDQ